MDCICPMQVSVKACMHAENNEMPPIKDNSAAAIVSQDTD